MIEYAIILRDKAENIRQKLFKISSPYDDTLFLDLSLNTREYRVVNKGNGAYLLYIVYTRLGLLGAFSNYKTVFFCKQVGDFTRIYGKIKLKSFTIMGLTFWFLAWGIILCNELMNKDQSSVSTIIMGITIITWILVEYFFFKKKVGDFFSLLEQAPLPSTHQ